MPFSKRIIALFERVSRQRGHLGSRIQRGMVLKKGELVTEAYRKLLEADAHRMGEEKALNVHERLVNKHERAVNRKVMSDFDDVIKIGLMNNPAANRFKGNVWANAIREACHEAGLTKTEAREFIHSPSFNRFVLTQKVIQLAVRAEKERSEGKETRVQYRITKMIYAMAKNFAKQCDQKK